jgi:hypothetical protein
MLEEESVKLLQIIGSIIEAAIQGEIEEENQVQKTSTVVLACS